MTEANYNTLKHHKHVYDFYLQVQTINTAHPSIGAINAVIVDEGGQAMNLGCSGCVIEGLNTIYQRYKEYESTHL